MIPMILFKQTSSPSPYYFNLYIKCYSFFFESITVIRIFITNSVDTSSLMCIPIGRHLYAVKDSKYKRKEKKNSYPAFTTDVHFDQE